MKRAVAGSLSGVRVKSRYTSRVMMKCHNFAVAQLKEKLFINFCYSAVSDRHLAPTVSSNPSEDFLDAYGSVRERVARPRWPGIPKQRYGSRCAMPYLENRA